MNIRCRCCGREIGIPNTLEEGTRVRCPTCGGDFIYTLPVPGEANGGVAEGQPRFRVIRPVANEAAAGGRTNSLVDQVNARARAASRVQRMARSKSRLTNMAVVAFLAAAGWAGYQYYLCSTGQCRSGLVYDLTRKLSLGPKGNVPSPNASRGVKSIARVELVKPASVPQPAAKNAGAASSAPEAVASGRLDAARAMFRACPLSTWGKLPKDERPGAVDRKFYLLVPASPKANCYELASQPNHQCVMKQIVDEGTPAELGYAEYVKLMSATGGFVLADGIAYFVSPVGSMKSYQAPSRQGETFDPAKAMFGRMYDMAKEMDASPLRFDVYFAFDDKATPIKVGNVGFGETVAYEAFAKVADGIVRDINGKRVPPAAKKGSFKKTLVLYDGAHIVRGVDGVTKVPRIRPKDKNLREWKEWPELYDLALRQEREAERAENEAARVRKAWENKVKAPASESEIRTILIAGKVTVSRS